MNNIKHPLIQVGAGKVILDFYNNDNLALKHRQIEELCHEMQKHFNISMLEAADYDDPERGVIAFSAVIPEHWDEARAQGFMDKVCKTIDQKAPARVTLEDWEVFPLES